MMNSTCGSCLSLYHDAVTILQSAATECQKTSNVDITLMLASCHNCAELLQQIKNQEFDPIRMASLEQLSEVLNHHQEVLSAKISQLDQALWPGSSAIKTTSKASSPHCNGSESLAPARGRKHSSSSDSPNEHDNHKKCRRLAIEDTIVRKGQLTFKHVAGLHQAKQALREAIILPLQFPHLFTGGRKPWTRILLYGPPGTGKSRLAQAMSSEINSSFYCVSSADLVSSWVGESEKLIKELFQHATRQHGRSVIFIDEIDSVCRQRSSREEEHTRRIKTELLHQMEGADTADHTDQLFLLCATNCPWELDTAFLRRFQRRIYIPLPDREARQALIHIHSRDNDIQLSENDWDILADRTEGYSGSDISTVVLGALFEPIRDMELAHHWKHTPDGKLTPCKSDEQGAFKTHMAELPPQQVKPRDVCLQDFLQSLSNHRQTVTPSELEKFEQFTNSFGQSG